MPTAFAHFHGVDLGAASSLDWSVSFLGPILGRSRYKRLVRGIKAHAPPSDSPAPHSSAALQCPDSPLNISHGHALGFHDATMRQARFHAAQRSFAPPAKNPPRLPPPSREHEKKTIPACPSSQWPASPTSVISFPSATPTLITLTPKTSTGRVRPASSLTSSAFRCAFLTHSPSCDVFLPRCWLVRPDYS